MLWVEVLNQSVAWDEGAGIGSSPLAPDQLEALRRDLTILRAAYAAPALGRDFSPHEFAAMEQWLADVTLSSRGPETDGSTRPALRARRRTTSLPDALDARLSTAFVQLQALEGVTAVQRCHGLVRAATSGPRFKPEDEALFARRAGLGEIPGEWRQCPRLVSAPRAAHFCSKACSNVAFALRKAVREPRYFAEKQRLYRARQRGTPSRPASPSAFMFVD